MRYEIGRDSAGLVIDPVRLNQAHHRGSWATVANVDFSGGRLWLLLGDYPSEASGPNDWCRWGGHHSIGAANARIVATTSTTPTTTTPGTAAPSEPLNVEAAVHGTRQLRVTWSSPLDSGSSAIKHYTVQYSRGALRGVPPWRSRLYTTTSTSHISPNLRYGTTYTITVTAVNRDDVRGESYETSRSIPPGRIYVDDEPELLGAKSLNCVTGGTKSCWKHYRHRYNTYFKRPNDKEFIIERRFSANDYWGTNGFHVVYIDPAKRQRAFWQFDNVAQGSYQVEVYLPDVYGDNSRQPGAIVRYRVEVDDRRVLTTQIDQSQRHNRGGGWISLGRIEAALSSKVEVFVSSYWPSDAHPDSYAARPSGTAGWRYHLAADAARLKSAPGVVDWSTLGTAHRNAVAWCQVDAFVTLFIEPLYNILKGMAVDRAIDAAVVAGGAAVTAATGGTAAPVAAVAVATRLGLSVKTALTVGRIVQSLRSAYRVLEKAKTVADYVGDIDTLHTLISHVGQMITDPTGETGFPTDLDTLCNIETVWENYYGEPSFWDRLKTRIVNLFGKVIEWVT